MKLSKRETQILQLLANDCRRYEVAAALKIADQTVATHLYRLRRKLRIRTFQGMVAVALREGFIQ